MTDKELLILIAAIVILHFIVGIFFLIYKIVRSAKKNNKKIG